MNMIRIAVLVVAVIAAGGAALLVRGMLGGGTPGAEAIAPQIDHDLVEVMVAAERIDPGRSLTPNAVRWEEWPRHAVSPEMIAKTTHPNLAEFVEGQVARAPLLEGEPLTNAKIIRTDHASFMAATLAPGKRAVSLEISAESGAGGFILPNDRVDVVLTRENNTDQFTAETILSDVRVLAIDQTLERRDDEQYVVAKTATLELGPADAEMLSEAQASGVLSLALRALGEDANLSNDDNSSARRRATVTVLRYGIARGNEANLSRGVRTQ